MSQAITLAQATDEDVDAAALAYRSGDEGALPRLRALLDDDTSWTFSRARRGLLAAPSLEQGDLHQEAWLALIEAVLAWQPDLDGPFRPLGVRAFRRTMQRCMRRNRRRGPSLGSAGEVLDGAEQADDSAHADPERWASLLLARDVAGRMVPRERAILVRRSVGEQPLSVLAHAFGLTRRGTRNLLARAQMSARALAGAAPPDATVEARVLRVISLGADATTRLVPPNPWLVARTGLGRRRVRATLRRLGQLGYLEQRRGRWLLRQPVSLGDSSD